jgi:opacity protein-like surface antigen
MGFGARGIGMGNAMSSVTEGTLVSYYNPAVSVFQADNLVQTGYSFLSLDRSLNFLSYTRRINIYSSKDTSANRKPRSTAGISAGIINSGVSDIQEADNSGQKGDKLSTSENQFFLAFAIRFSEKVSAGVGLKLYYNKLYEEISSTGVGLDIGLLYKINDQWNVAFVLADLNSKYEWDTTPIYEQEGMNTKYKFPVLKKAGVSYRNPELKLLVSAEFEGRNSETNIVRAGLEYNIIDGLYLRAGIDQWNISNSDYPVKPAAGFSYFMNWNNIRLGVDYAFMIEQYSPQDRHVIGLNFRF